MNCGRALSPATCSPLGRLQERAKERLEFLKAGDVIETEVEGLGRQKNKVVAGSSAYSAGHVSTSIANKAAGE